MPIVKGNLFAVLGRCAPKGCSILPPFSIFGAGQVGRIENLLSLQIVHKVPNNAVVFGVLACRNAGPYRVVFGGKDGVDKRNGGAMFFQVLKGSQPLFVAV